MVLWLPEFRYRIQDKLRGRAWYFFFFLPPFSLPHATKRERALATPCTASSNYSRRNQHGSFLGYHRHTRRRKLLLGQCRERACKPVAGTWDRGGGTEQMEVTRDASCQKRPNPSFLFFFYLNFLFWGASLLTPIGGKEHIRWHMCQCGASWGKSQQQPKRYVSAGQDNAACTEEEGS